MTFDTLTYARKLQDAGVPEAQAAAQATALRDAFREQEATLATKADLAELRADFAELRADVRTDVQSMRTAVTQLDARFAQMDTRFAQMDTSFAQMDTRFAQMEARLMRWMLAGAGVGGLAGGLVAAVAKIF
jgi:phage shock protein A